MTAGIKNGVNSTITLGVKTTHLMRTHLINNVCYPQQLERGHCMYYTAALHIPIDSSPMLFINAA